MKKPEDQPKNRGLLTDDAAIDRYFVFIAGGLFGIFMSSAVPALVAAVIETLGLHVR